MDKCTTLITQLSAYTINPLGPSCSSENEELYPVMKSVYESRTQLGPSGQERADGLIEWGAS
jgi:hypothetical protein